MSHDRLRLLLLDDEKSFRQPLSRYLEKNYGFQIDQAVTGEEALALAKMNGGQYDVALIDQTLGTGLDGITVMRKLRADYPKIECIILTGWGNDERQMALKEGAFLEKPIIREQLARMVLDKVQAARMQAISSEILMRPEPGDVLRTIIAAASTLVQADETVIALYDKTTGRWTLHFANPERYRPAQKRLLGNQAIAARVTRSGTPLFLSNLEGDTVHSEAAALGFESLAVVPIPGPLEHNEGVLFAYSRRQDNFETWGNVAPLHALAAQAGLALDNARVFRRTTDLATYMAELVHTSRALTQTTDQDALLALAWDFVKNVLGADTFLVALVDEEASLIRYPLVYDKGKPLQLDPIDLPKDDGIVAHVIRSGNDYYWPTAEERRAACRELGIVAKKEGRPCRSCFFHSLKVGDRVLGCFSVQSYSPHAFERVFRRACQALGNQLAVALDNARLLRDIRNKAADLHTLQRLSADVASSLDWRQVTEGACRRVVELMGADHSGLVLFDDALEYGEVRAEYPPEVGALGQIIPLRGIPAEETLISRREPLPVSDVASNDDLGEVRDVLGRYKIVSTLVIPVVAKDRLYGSFSVDYIKSHRRFNKHDIELGQSLAEQVGLALDHAGLYAEATDRGIQLERLDNALRQVRAEKEPRELLHQIVRMGALLLDCRAGCLLMVEPDTSALVLSTPYHLPPGMARETVPVDGLFKEVLQGECRDWIAGRDAPLPLGRLGGWRRAFLAPLAWGTQTRAILVLGDSDDGPLTQLNRDILLRYSGRVADVLQTSMSLTAESRSLTQVAILNKASQYVQTDRKLEDILLIVLTGITAGYGSGLNRAAIWLRQGEELVGTAGVGHFDEGVWRAEMERDGQGGRKDFEHFITRLEEGQLDALKTPLWSTIRESRIPLGDDVMSQLVTTPELQLITAEEQERLPAEMVRVFQPAFPLVLAPLVVRDKVLGVLAADNRFTDAPITETLRESLRGFARTAAVAVSNAQLYQAAQRRLVEALQLRETAEALAETREPRAALELIVKSAHDLLGTSFVVVIPFDERHERFLSDEVVVAGDYPENELDYVQSSGNSRPGRTALGVFEDGYRAVPDVTKADVQLFSGRTRELHRRLGIRSSQAVALTAGMERLGILYANYDQPRNFEPEDEAALRAFSNHAAAALKTARALDQVNQIRDAAARVAGLVVREELEATLQAVAEVSRLTLGADVVTVYAYDELTKAFTDFGHSTVNQHITDMLRRSEDLRPDSVIYEVIQLDAEPYRLLHDKAHEHPSLILSEFARNAGIKSSVGLQLHSDDRRLGVMFVNYRSLYCFNDSDIATITLFANQAMAAIRNNYLFRDAHQREKTLTMLNEAAKEISSANTLADTFHQIAIQSVRLVGADAGGVCHLALVWGDRIQFVGASTPETLVQLQTKIGVLDPAVTPDMGLIGRVVRTGESMIFDEAPLEPEYLPFEPDTQSEMLVPIHHAGQVIGVINIEHPSRSFFRDEHRNALEALAAQAAVAIQNAQLLAQQQVVADISREVNVIQSLESFLEVLFARLLEVFAARQMRIFPSLGIYIPAAEALFTYHTSFYPTNIRPNQVAISNRGIMSKVARTREYHLSTAVEEDPDYNLLLTETRSEIAVPLFFGDELLGVLDLESPIRNAFIPQDVELLQRLGRHIATTIHSLEQDKQINRTRAIVDARTAVARWGMVATAKKHSTINDIIAAELHVNVIEELVRSSSDEESADSLQALRALLKQIREMPTLAPLGPEEGVKPVNLCELLNDKLDQWSGQESYRAIHFIYRFPKEEEYVVRVNPGWLIWTMEILLGNAAEAMKESPIKELEVTIGRHESGVGVTVRDTGKGIPPEIEKQLFKRVIEGSSGSGVGLLSAQLVLLTYGGDIELVETSGEGSRFLFKLPIVS